MRRKDGKPKRKARRTMPVFNYGFRDNPLTEKYRHSCWSGVASPQNYSVVSLFAGCGGLDLGVAGGFEYLGQTFESLPFDIIYAIDNKEDAVVAYKLNLGNHAVLGDLTTKNVDEIPNADILMGGFPCQDFSSSGPKVGFAGERGQLYQVMTDYMLHHQPKIVIGENVPYLARLRGGAYLDTILRDFENAGYRFDVWDLYGPDYGLPQSRRRLFLIGVREDISGYPVKPPATHQNKHIPIDVGIGDLEKIDNESVTNQSQYFVATRATAGGGQGDHTNQSGKVAYCIRANSRGRIQFHYNLPRRLTVRECARLQAFPDEFVFPFSTQRNLTLIGNAVPPIMGHYVAVSIKEFLSSIEQRNNGQHIGSSFVSAEKTYPTQLKLFDTTTRD